MALATALIEAPALATAPMSYWRTVAWRLARDRATLIAGGVLAVIVLSAVLAPWLAPYDPAAGSIRLRLAPVGATGHVLGTDEQGRDMLSRLLWGGRMTLVAGLTPVLVGDHTEGIFSARTSFSRLRVQQVFAQAVVSASDAPRQPMAEALGRLLYLVHLAVLLWWLLDKSSSQRATAALVSLTRQLLPSATLALRVPAVRRFLISVDELARQALFDDPATA